ncbi:hypothetical protein GCM10009564_06730 [Streptomyces thermogriseus]|uniref:Uncharacterized protein n=1 Tax=Streptomyces thermogriseus TaxID=75292 RepID=A0ABN1STE2_9ACTN
MAAAYETAFPAYILPMTASMSGSRTDRPANGYAAAIRATSPAADPSPPGTPARPHVRHRLRRVVAARMRPGVPQRRMRVHEDHAEHGVREHPGHRRRPVRRVPAESPRHDGRAQPTGTHARRLPRTRAGEARQPIAPRT